MPSFKPHMQRIAKKLSTLKQSGLYKVETKPYSDLSGAKSAVITIERINN